MTSVAAAQAPPPPPQFVATMPSPQGTDHLSSGKPTALLTNESARGSSNILSSILAESSHPTALLLHYLFRTAALLIYLLAGLVSSSFVVIFVATVVVLASDFWVVKNVTGRMLVGRRWWSRTAADGSTVWSFEARPEDEYRPNAMDRKLFWMGLYVFTGIWTLLGIVAILRLNFSWLMVVGVALTMNLTNLMGYLKCDREAQTSLGGTLSGGGIGGSLLSGYIGNKISSLLQ